MILLLLINFDDLVSWVALTNSFAYLLSEHRYFHQFSYGYWYYYLRDVILPNVVGRISGSSSLLDRYLVLAFFDSSFDFFIELRIFVHWYVKNWISVNDF